MVFLQPLAMLGFVLKLPLQSQPMAASPFPTKKDCLNVNLMSVYLSSAA